MRDSLRHAVAEFIGTFALVFVGSGILLLARVTGQPISLLEIAMAHGLILAVMVTATMSISGHLNPAVTIGFLATRRIAPRAVVRRARSAAVPAVVRAVRDARRDKRKDPHGLTRARTRARVTFPSETLYLFYGNRPQQQFLRRR